jgi:hypothetical protein
MGEGVFAVGRSLFDHPIFAAEPFTEREAWIWLIKEAAWKPRRVRVRGGAMELERGQLAHATRFMAQRWQWSEARVRRYLARLKADGMVELESGSQATRITIRSYDAFQKVSLPPARSPDAQPDAESTRQRRKPEAWKDLGIPPSEGARPTRGASRIPEDWTVPEPYVAHARARGVPEAEIALEAEKFHNHWKAKAGGDALKRDWFATWANWIARSAEWKGYRPAAGTAPVPAIDLLAGRVFVAEGTAHWETCARRYRRERGVSPQPRDLDAGRGWYFPAGWLGPEGAG